MKKKLLFIVLTILFLSCQNDKREPEIQPTESPVNNIKTKENPLTKEKNVKKDFNSEIITFLKLMYKNDYAIIDLYPQENYYSPYTKSFSKIDLNKITIYGNKKIEKYQKLYYEQFDVVLLEYNTKKSAKNSFNLLKKMNQKVNNDNFETDSEIRKNSMNLGVKSGGFIFQNDQYIISLVKRCSGNNLKNISWKKYESKFIECLKLQDSTIQVLYGRCGHMKFNLIEQKF
ncbi:hypothetical protein [Aureivirga sp. CE67]|uniref:hypothetical protein n=1 Tax=Aureivirga sp. CE67 TaxID=1788983 RepID=UPI0018C95274|nr:hypothetical protein [Aureivirga sp. CE67]